MTVSDSTSAALEGIADRAVARCGLEPARAAELRAELVSHLEDGVLAQLTTGRTEPEALDSVLLAFGSPELLRGRMVLKCLRQRLRQATRLPFVVTLLLSIDVLSLIAWMNYEMPPAWDIGLRRQAVTVVASTYGTLLYWTIAVALTFSFGLVTKERRRLPRSVVVGALCLMASAVSLWLFLQPGALPGAIHMWLDRRAPYFTLIRDVALVSLLALACATLAVTRQLHPTRAS